jgi:hypothetical protein
MSRLVRQQEPDRATHEQRTVRVGGYHSELFDVDHARTAALALKWRIGMGEDVAQSQRQAKAQQAKLSGVAVDQVIDERIEWMKTKVRKSSVSRWMTALSSATTTRRRPIVGPWQ